ncbi:MAG TPA: hypothetical protein VFN19_02055 [Candidatus Nanopelagicales bacterium]|jgi:modulator of FtsH protease|nr:hypothetical protein [Candidatus Nanopelagicales bacterium]
MAWHEFGVALAGAAAALCGLAFVAISLNLQDILADRTLPGRAAETLLYLGAPLIGALLLLVPGQSDAALGVEVLALTVVLGTLLLRIDLPRLREESELPASWRLAHVAPTVVALLLLVLGALGLITGGFAGVPWLAGAFLLLLVFGLANCWVLLVEIKR